MRNNFSELPGSPDEMFMLKISFFSMFMAQGFLKSGHCEPASARPHGVVHRLGKDEEAEQSENSYSEHQAACFTR